MLYENNDNSRAAVVVQSFVVLRQLSRSLEEVARCILNTLLVLQPAVEFTISLLRPLFVASDSFSALRLKEPGSIYDPGLVSRANNQKLNQLKLKNRLKVYISVQSQKLPLFSCSKSNSF